MALREDLVLQQGLKEIGPIKENHQMVIPPNSRFSRALEIRRNGTYKDMPWPVIFSTWRELGIENHLIKQRDESRVLFDGMVDVFQIEIVSLSVFEAVTNAIRGSGYGIRGAVSVDFHRGESGLLVVIEDPGQGFEFQHLIKTPPTPGKTVDGRSINNGLARMAESRRAQIWFEKIQEGFRTNLLFTLSPHPLSVPTCRW